MKEAEKKLVQMKNLSELMVDLSYSALLYHNRDIAEEMLELEDKVDELYGEILAEAVKGNQEEKENTRAVVLIKMADSIERIADAALDISDVVLRDIELHPVIKKSLEESDELMVRRKIEKGSSLDGKTLQEALIPSKTGIWIRAVRRGKKWKYAPSKDLQLKSGDVIFAKGPEDSIDRLEKWVNS